MCISLKGVDRIAYSSGLLFSDTVTSRLEVSYIEDDAQE